MSHNSHTHTGNTCQSEPQLKECWCSSAIPSHNLRDVILSHNSRNATCLPFIPSHNSRDTISSNNSRNSTTSPSWRYHPKPCRPHTYNTYTHLAALSPGTTQNCQAKTNSKPSDGTLLLSGTECLKVHCLCRYCLAGRPSPPGSTLSSAIVCTTFA